MADLGTSGVVAGGLVLPRLLAGRFCPLGPLGRGAIAEVIRARDEESGGDVALKIVHPHLRDSAVVVERFRREVEIVRRIVHPNILPIHQVFDSDGLLFLVMDLHPGGDLADRLARSGRLPVNDLLALARQLCGALGAAHRAGVVHRDVKPSNVLCGDGPGLDLRLCDFGLARTAEQSGLTLANAVLGTPEYMAPEVIAEGQADPRSDLYSLGVVLFEAATGRLPFQADSPYQLMRQHLDAEPPRAASIMTDLPPGLDAAIARALAKDPLDRFATAEDFARAVAGPADLVAGVAPSSRRSSCPTCGGWLIDAAATCADCGARALRLVWRWRGVSVLVVGPGKTADKIDAWTHVALSKLIAGVPGTAGAADLRRKPAPRIPFYVAKGLDRDSAEQLVQRLKTIGLETVVLRPSLLPRGRMAKKTTSFVGRSLAIFGGLQAFSQMLPRISIPLFLAVFGVLGGTGVVAAVRDARPLIGRVRRRADLGIDPELTEAVGRLASRQDRRLVGRVIERLAALQASGQPDLPRALSARAALAVRGLVAVDQRRGAEAAEGGAAAPALTELRREEQARIVFRSDLLRTASRLESAQMILARAAAAGSHVDATDLDTEIDELDSAAAAEEELQRWLGGRE